MTDSDLKLARQARRGDRRALESLYDRHKGPLLGYLRKTLASAAEADDVFQEVWIKVMQALPSYKPTGGSIRPWLFRIATNAAVDRIRRETRRRGPELDGPVGDDSDERKIDRIADEGPSPEQRGLGASIGRDLDHALQQLPERQRSAILLRHQQGLRYHEIGHALNIPEGTAKTLVHRGVLALRRKLPQWSDDA